MDELTDEEDFTDNPERSNANEYTEIACTFEIHRNEDDLYDDSDDETLACKRQKLLEYNATSRKPKWREGQFLHKNLPESNEAEMIQVVTEQLQELTKKGQFLSRW